MSNRPTRRQLQNEQTAASQAVALSHGTMFQRAAELYFGEADQELRAARTIDHFEEEFSKTDVKE